MGTKLCPGRSPIGLAREASSVLQYEPSHETGGEATNQKPGKRRQRQSSASAHPCNSQLVRAFPSPHGLEVWRRLRGRRGQVSAGLLEPPFEGNRSSRVQDVTAPGVMGQGAHGRRALGVCRVKGCHTPACAEGSLQPCSFCFS